MRLSLRFRQLSHKSYAARLNLNRLCGTTTIATHTHTHNRCLHQSMINWWNYPRRLGRLSPQRGANEASSTLWLSKMQSTTDALLCPALSCRVLWRVGVNNNMKLQQQRTGDFVGGKKRFEVFALLWFELFWFDVISQCFSLMFFDTHQHTLAQRATCCTQYRE